MKDDQPGSMTTPRNVGYLGLLPFFAGAVGPWVFPSALDWLTNVFTWYSLAILSLTAGSIWGVALQHNVSARDTHLVAAKTFLVAGWLSILLPVHFAVTVLALCHFALLQWERFTHLKHPLGPEYLQLRHKLTWPAIACHMLVLFNFIRAVKTG